MSVREVCVYKLKLTEKITLTLKKQYKIQFQEKKVWQGVKITADYLKN